VSEPQSSGPTPEPKVIKRYSNRKLYDTERSKYVTLDEIAKMIKAGEEVTIIDNESKEDLTSVTLTQIIYEEEKRESRMPLSMLRNLIQTGGEALTEFFDKSVKTPALEATRTMEKGVEELKQSAIGLREAATRSVTELTGSAKRLFAERKSEEFKKAILLQIDELEERLKTRIQDVQPEPESSDNEQEKSELLDAHKIDAHAAMLRERLDALRQLVDELERLGHRHKN
jgi:polyhydroxyalkanoate synthesis repressor PhaR